MKNYYDILQVNKNASKEVISRVYKYLIKENHPDLFQGKDKELAEIKVKQLNEAYDVLTDDRKRKDFDEELEYYNSLSSNPNIMLKNLQQENENLKSELFEKTQILNKIYEEFPVDEYGNVLINKNGYFNSNNMSNQKESLKDYYSRTFKDFFIRVMILIFFLFLVVLISSSLIGRNILFPNSAIEKNIE